MRKLIQKNLSHFLCSLRVGYAPEMFTTPLAWIFLAFGPIAYGNGKGMIILLGVLFVALGLSLHNKKIKLFSLHDVLSWHSISFSLVSLLLLWGYMSLSSLWSLAPLAALGTSFRVGITLIFGIFSILWLDHLSVKILKRCLLFLSIGWVGLFCVLCSDVLAYHITGHPFYIIFPFKEYSFLTKQGLFLSLFFWPVCGFLIFFSRLQPFASFSFSAQKIVFLGLGILLLVVTYFLPMRAASIALASGLIGYYILNRYPHLLTGILGSLIGGGFLFPILHSVFLNSNPLNPSFISAPFISWQHRIFIWNFTYEKIKEHPYFGWGLDGSRSLPKDLEWMSFRGQNGILEQHLLSPLSSHPHNAFFQLWLEGGLIGAFLLACLLFSFVLYIKRNYDSSHERALLGGTFISFLTPFYVSFGIWQTWWIATLCFIIILCKMTKKIK